MTESSNWIETNIKVLRSAEDEGKLRPGYLDGDDSLPKTAYITPSCYQDFISIDEIRYLNINGILWRIEETSTVNPPNDRLPPYFTKFTLSKM